MARVRVLTDGGDTRAIAVDNGSGHALFAGMDKQHQNVIKAKIRRKKLSLDPI